MAVYKVPQDVEADDSVIIIRMQQVTTITVGELHKMALKMYGNLVKGVVTA